MNFLIDIGCNLASSRLFPQYSQHIKQAEKAGVIGQILTSSDLDSCQKLLNIAEKTPNIWLTAGVHPHNAWSWNRYSSALFQIIARHNKKIVAIGETGLDYWRNLSSKMQQKAAFIQQIQLATYLNKPLFLHEREAFTDFQKILNKFDNITAVWHCFTANEKALDWALERGFYIGITGWLIDSRGEQLRKLVKKIPDNRILLETDAPYLTPKTLNPLPKYNQPCFLPEILQQCAFYREQAIANLAKNSLINSCSLFNIKINKLSNA